MRWGKVNYKDFERLEKKLTQMEEIDIDTFCRMLSNELAARLLRRLIKQTPVDTGVLRKGWGGYAASLPITKKGNVYEVEITNPTEYGIYVNYGHRTTIGGWVEGQYFLEIAVDDVERQADKIIEKKLNIFLAGLFK
jgi:hypothetical protein